MRTSWLSQEDAARLMDAAHKMREAGRKAAIATFRGAPNDGEMWKQSGAAEQKFERLVAELTDGEGL